MFDECTYFGAPRYVPFRKPSKFIHFSYQIFRQYSQTPSFCIFFIGKVEVHPVTGHEGPEWE
jgi:hypothetical protein